VKLSLKQLEVDMKELEVSLSEVQKGSTTSVSRLADFDCSELAESDKIVEEAMRIPLKRNLSAFLAFAVEKYPDFPPLLFPPCPHSLPGNRRMSRR
jgi:hypothetical protein